MKNSKNRLQLYMEEMRPKLLNVKIPKTFEANNGLILTKWVYKVIRHSTNLPPSVGLYYFNLTCGTKTSLVFKNC